MPLNYILVHDERWASLYSEVYVREIGALTMKAAAMRKWLPRERRIYPKCWYRPIADPRIASLAIRYVLSQPVTSTIPSGQTELFRMALDLSDPFEPLATDELDRIKSLLSGSEPLF